MIEDEFGPALAEWMTDPEFRSAYEAASADPETMHNAELIFHPDPEIVP